MRLRRAFHRRLHSAHASPGTRYGSAERHRDRRDRDRGAAALIRSFDQIAVALYQSPHGLNLSSPMMLSDAIAVRET
jgi:hypothetical protein